jgi:hypothetical protein
MSAMHRGTIVQLGGRPFGWIQSTAGRIFFGAAQLRNVTMIDLKVSDVVEFRLCEDSRGRREARDVRLISRRTAEHRV